MTKRSSDEEARVRKRGSDEGSILAVPWTWNSARRRPGDLAVGFALPLPCVESRLIPKDG